MFNVAYWKHDLRASLVVFLVALPLCLGVALASNAPLSSGLIAGIIGGIVVGFFSSSHVSVSGPAAGLTVIVASAITDLGSFQVFTLSVFLAGLLQIIFSFMKGGSLGNYFPSSVIKGMLAAIGLILILKQFPHAVGFDNDFMGNTSFIQKDGQNTFSEIMLAIRSTHFGSILVALLSLFIMLGWERAAQKGKSIFQLIPGALVAVLSAVLMNEMYKHFFPGLIIDGQHLVKLPYSGGFNEFFTSFALPDWSALSNSKVYVTAFVIAIVASIESLLSVDAADKLSGEGRITSKNRELFAQGMGNTLCGLVGGIPVTAVIVRTSANITGGAKTKLSAILHGVWLLSCVITIPFILNLIPLSTLAIVLILVGYKLTKPKLVKEMYQKGMNQFIPFMVTILAILFTDLLMGIIIGMMVGFVFVIRSNMHKSIVMVQEGNQYLIRFYKDVSFLQKSTLMKIFQEIPENSSVVIDGSKNVFVDDDIVDLIEDFIKHSKKVGTSVELMKSSLALSSLFKEGVYGQNTKNVA